jgi:hypothetical protein
MSIFFWTRSFRQSRIKRGGRVKRKPAFLHSRGRFVAYYVCLSIPYTFVEDEHVFCRVVGVLFSEGKDFWRAFVEEIHRSSVFRMGLVGYLSSWTIHSMTFEVDVESWNYPSIFVVGFTWKGGTRPCNDRAAKSANVTHLDCHRAEEHAFKSDSEDESISYQRARP